LRGNVLANVVSIGLVQKFDTDNCSRIWSSRVLGRDNVNNLLGVINILPLGPIYWTPSSGIIISILRSCKLVSIKPRMTWGAVEINPYCHSGLLGPSNGLVEVSLKPLNVRISRRKKERPISYRERNLNCRHVPTGMRTVLIPVAAIA
jgi:hypothetical protein